MTCLCYYVLWKVWYLYVFENFSLKFFYSKTEEFCCLKDWWMKASLYYRPNFLHSQPRFRHISDPTRNKHKYKYVTSWKSPRRIGHLGNGIWSGNIRIHPKQQENPSIFAFEPVCLRSEIVYFWKIYMKKNQFSPIRVDFYGQTIFEKLNSATF